MQNITDGSSAFLTTYQVLPPDFVLEIHHLEDGRIETNRIGIPHKLVSLMTYGGMTHWFRQAAIELGKLLKEKFDVDDYDVLSACDHEDFGHVLWLRSRYPVTKKLAGQSTLPAAPDFFDVDAKVQTASELSATPPAALPLAFPPIGQLDSP